MEIKYKTLDISGYTQDVKINEPEICPICGHAIKPQILNSKLYTDNENNVYVTFSFLCNGCYSSFIYQTKLLYNSSIGTYVHTGQPVIGPQKIIPITFPKSVCDKSPNFVEIYNQAYSAETYALNHVAGIGYRKSLEFLVKDFLISLKPDQEETIKNVALGTCITNYIDNEKIKALAKASTWIGNDETHYVRKHENYDVDDLKKFINALVSYIDSELLLQEALNLTSK